jgi:recombination protein RecA
MRKPKKGIEIAAEIVPEVAVTPVEYSKQGEGLISIAHSLEALHGEKSMLYLGEHPDYAMVKRWVSTQNRALDWIISGRADGSGGLPSGRIIEFFGDPSSGKSLILAHVLAEAQRRGGIVALIDTEATFDENFARRIGLDPTRMFYSRAYRKEKRKVKVVDETGIQKEIEIDAVVSASVERITKILEDLIDLTRHKFPDELFVIGLDSVAILTTEHELDEPDKKDLSKAGGIRSFVRKLEGKISELDIMLICTNHTIANIDMNPFSRKIGPREQKTTPGGSGLPFGTSLRLDLNRGIDIKEKHHGAEIVIGHEIWAHTYKSKVFPARKKVIIEMRYETGVEPYSGLLDILVAKGIVDEMGSAVYRFGGQRFKRHKMEKYPGFDQIVVEHPELLTHIQGVV